MNLPNILVNPGAPTGNAGGSTPPSPGFFGSFYQNVKSTAETAAAQKNNQSWWDTALQSIGTAAAAYASTRIQQATNQGTTPVQVPQVMPPASNQSPLPPEHGLGPGQFTIAGNGATTGGNQGLLLIAGIGALFLFAGKR